MSQRIEFTGFVDVYEDGPLTDEDAKGWVKFALLRGDKHASDHSASLGKVLSVENVKDDD